MQILILFAGNAVDKLTCQFNVNRKLVSNYYQGNVGGNAQYANDIIVDKVAAYQSTKNIYSLPDGSYCCKVLSKGVYSFFLDFTNITDNIYYNGNLLTDKRFQLMTDYGALYFEAIKGEIFIYNQSGTWNNIE